MKNVIYKISNKINDHIYIGSSKKFSTRYTQHKSSLKRGIHHSKILQNFVNKYGFESLIFEVLEKDVSNLIEREQFYLDSLKPYFNVRKIAESNKGMVMSEETKRKIGAKNKGRLVSEDVKKRISESLKGKVVLNSTTKKLSVQKKGIKNPMYGKEKELHHNYGKKWICKERKNNKKVIDTDTGIIYNSSTIAAKLLKIPRSTFVKYVLGYTEKVKNFKYYD